MEKYLIPPVQISGEDGLENMVRLRFNLETSTFHPKSGPPLLTQRRKSSCGISTSTFSYDLMEKELRAHEEMDHLMSSQGNLMLYQGDLLSGESGA